MAAAIAALVVASFQPWSGGGPGDDLIANAWANRRWGEAVMLALVAGVALLAYRSRNAVGAAGLAVVMLVGALGLHAWELHRVRKVVVTEVSLLTAASSDAPQPSAEEMRRPVDEALAAGLGVEHRTRIWPAFYTGMGATTVMLMVAVRALVAARRRTPGPTGA